MTQVPLAPTKIIVVAEESVYDLLRDAGIAWDVQGRVDAVGQMWDELSGGRLDAQSVAIVFSDSAYAGAGELEGAIAAMAPFAATFVVAWKADQAHALLAGIAASAKAQGVQPAPVHLLDPSNKRVLLDTMNATLVASGVHVGFPAQYAVHVDGGLEAVVVEAPVWDPGDQVAVAPVMVAPPVAVEAPVAVTPTYQPAPVAYAPAPVLAPTPVTYETPQYSAPAPVANTGAAGGKPILPGQVTMAVTSSKGGSGKSTTAMMLATQIAQSSKLAYEAGLVEKPLKVCLVDMDTRDGQVASLIGRHVPTALNIRVSPVWDEETILANLVYDQKLGIDALLAPVRPRTADDVGPDFYRHVLEILKTTHDVVIMDTSVNYLDPLISTVCLPMSTAILFVTTLATTSVQGMARALREITEPAETGGMGISRSKIGIVVNQSITEVGMDRDQVLQAALKVAIVGAIPLATKDVLTCTNYNRMHQLLKHPLLGPAYFKLAKTCLKKHELLPVLAAGPGPAAPPVIAPPGAPTGPQGAPNTLTPTDTGDKKRGGLFGRKG